MSSNNKANASSPFHTLPHEPTIPLTPFVPQAPKADLERLKTLLQAAQPIRPTYENTTRAKGDGVQDGEDLGVGKEWVEEGVRAWKEFDWTMWESRISRYANYHAHIELDGVKHDVHFAGLFSEKKDAGGLVMVHGWPGSFLEFIPLLDHLSKKYTPQTLPISIIVPSLIGYGYSSAPPIDRDFITKDNARVFDKLMLGLGFDGYVAQGGDVGSHVVRYMARFEGCRAIHVNMFPAPPPEEDKDDKSAYDSVDKDTIRRYQERTTWDFAYNQEQATKTSTIGIVVGSSPVALLAWLGEKLLAWSDPATTPSLDFILANVTLYWLTQSYSTGLYHYRSVNGRKEMEAGRPNAPEKVEKPMGYSHFTHELIPVPIQWVEKSGLGELVWSRRHERGGHYAALEVPETLWQDVEDFLEVIDVKK